MIKSPAAARLFMLYARWLDHTDRMVLKPPIPADALPIKLERYGLLTQ
jgi:hypothetical protein